MTAKLVGMVDLQRVLAELPEKMERRVLRGALKAGAEVIADAARENCRSPEVRESITTSVREATNRVITALVQTKGKHAFMAPWLEYGTDPHFMRARDSEGRSTRRINALARKGALMIGTAFVGDIVFHPGARPYPFMRPAADQRGDEAVEAVSDHIAARLGRLNAAYAGVAGDE